MSFRCVMLVPVAVCLSACYEPLPDPCRERECGRGCGACAGDFPHCTPEGACIDDCEGRECGPSPNEGYDCGTCEEDQACSPDGHCGCARNPCNDGYCPAAGECCTVEDCGEGAWSCQEHACVCSVTPCDDGRCPAAGACCREVLDDDRCGPDAICEAVGGDPVCVTGEDGALVIDGVTCEIDGAACPSAVLEQADPEVLTEWTLKDNTLRFSSVTISGGAILVAPPIDAEGNGGRLRLETTGTFSLAGDAVIDMSGRGWGGGGGGGGIQYCSNDAACKFGAAGGTGYEDPDGEPGGQGDATQCMTDGYQPGLVGSGSGGAGGGHGGDPGSNGGGCESRCSDPPYPLGDGRGGKGGGPFGGAGGGEGCETDEYQGYSNKCSHLVECDATEGPGGAPPLDAEEPAWPGERGGYAAARGNGDTSNDESVLVGSGGGGGAGGTFSSSGWCCGSADGGNGGVPGGEGRRGCVGGGGGGGGGAGGGAIEIRAKNILLRGSIQAHGAGRADLLGGYGAGGGILLSARHTLQIDAGAGIRTLGGNGDHAGSPINGGTIKMFYRTLEGQPPDTQDAGRVFENRLTP